jgi:nucleotide-binding universal stress UspA family protein
VLRGKFAMADVSDALIQVKEPMPFQWHQSRRHAENPVFKYILVPATGADTDAPVFSTALAISRRSGGHLAFLHVRIDVQQTLMAIATANMGGGIGYDQIFQTLEQDVATRQKKAELAFRNFCEREQLPISSDLATHRPSAEWRIEIGNEPTWLAEHGRAADLLVVGRARNGEPVAMDVLEACLMATGRPVLLAPARLPSRVSGTVAIAWKNRPEAARAVAAARPFVETADKVVVFSVVEDGEADELSYERLRYALSWHNPNTTVQRLKQDARPPVETLLAAVSAAEAGLLVMGGYGHSRMREVIFGGFTRRVLAGADLPILMAH